MGQIDGERLRKTVQAELFQIGGFLFFRFLGVLLFGQGLPFPELGRCQPIDLLDQGGAGLDFAADPFEFGIPVGDLLLQGGPLFVGEDFDPRDFAFTLTQDSLAIGSFTEGAHT